MLRGGASPLPRVRVDLKQVDVAPVHCCCDQEKAAGIELHDAKRGVVRAEVVQHLLRVHVADHDRPCVLQGRLGGHRLGERGRRAEVRVQSPQPHLAELLGAACHGARDADAHVKERAPVRHGRGLSVREQRLVGGVRQPARAEGDDAGGRLVREGVERVLQREVLERVDEQLVLEHNDEPLAVAHDAEHVAVELELVDVSITLQTKDLEHVQVAHLVPRHHPEHRLLPRQQRALRHWHRR
mmetsp:Transcript_14922/g.29961  ORF Transcript_14922/g.29961 Transcript_14922/m.29961 type:complete len:241 (-) Transcript_14922:633-1355(-)